jgi:hypothetical protein
MTDADQIARAISNLSMIVAVTGLALVLCLVAISRAIREGGRPT